MTDWEIFVEDVPRFIDDGANVSVSCSFRGLPLSSDVQLRFPNLSQLLERADVTPVAIDNADYHLLAWDGIDGYRIGWLCLPPSPSSVKDFHDDHQELLKCFGGIVERFNEPEETWLLNHYDALTQREGKYDASLLEYSMWAFEDAGVPLPIQPTEYYSIAREANGNTTFCHRSSGKVILFAADHAFDHVTELDGCPKYTLYTIDGVTAFCDWVEAIASQWLAQIEKRR